MIEEVNLQADAYFGWPNAKIPQPQTMMKQQRMVNAALGDRVKEWHGVQIRTVVPEEEEE